MIVVGLDPGSRHLGYSILSAGKARVGALHAPSDMPFAIRLVRLCSALATVLEEIDNRFTAFIEDVWVPRRPKFGDKKQRGGGNLRAALMIAQVRGAVLKEAATYAHNVEDVMPSTAKKTLTGNGRAEKKAVQSMAGEITGLKLTEDEADSFAIAYHGWTVTHSSLWRKK